MILLQLPDVENVFILISIVNALTILSLVIYKHIRKDEFKTNINKRLFNMVIGFLILLPILLIFISIWD